MEKVIPYEEFQTMVRLAPPNSGITAQSIAASLEKKGYTLAPELAQFSMMQPKEKTEGANQFFSVLKKRFQDPTQGGVTSGQKGSLSDIPNFGKAALPAAGSIVGGAVGGILGAPAGPVGIAAGIVGGAATGRAVGQVGAESIANLQGEGKGIVDEAKSVAGAAGRGAIEGAIDVATLGTMKVAGKVLPKVGKALKESAEGSIAKVLNPTTESTKAATQKLAPEIIDRPLSDTLALTRKGMQEKAGAAAEKAGMAIDDAGTLTGRTKTSELIEYLQSQKQQFVVDGKVVNEAGVKSIDEVTSIIEQYGDDVGNESLRKIRKIFDAEFYQGKKNIAKSVAETSTLSFKKEAADKIRGILAEKFPDVAKLNKEYNFWSSLEGVLEKTTARKTGQKSLAKAGAAIVGGGAGATAGGAGGAIAGSIAFRTVAALIDSPAWGFVSAKVKDRLADALVSQNLTEIGKLLPLLTRSYGSSTSDE